MKWRSLGVLVLLAVASNASAATLKEVKLDKGRNKYNTLTSPVIVASAALEIGTFVQEFPNGEVLNRRRSGGVRGGKLTTAPDLDLGEILTQALRAEAPPMGFELGSGGWKLGGTLKALYYDIRSNLWSAFYYGTIVVDVEIVSPEGETFNDTLQLYNYDPGASPYRAVALMLVEGSQEILARLNVRYFKFPADDSVGRMMSEISASPKGVLRKALECTAIGLSGSSEVVLPLLDVLKRTENENHRSKIVDALALLEDPRVIPVLAERYAEEDADVKWFILKTMGYLGSDEAMKVVQERTDDDDTKARLPASKACLALAQDVLDPSALVQPTQDDK